MDFTSVTPAIVICVYVLVELLKTFVLKTDKNRSFIPLFAIIGGICIALCIYKFYPEGNPYDNLVEAFASGGLSGAASTGCNQIYKQYQNYKSSE